MTSPAQIKQISSGSRSETASPVFKVHFGGPDKAHGALRDLLAKKIAAVPPGGSIDWITYYFRDRSLARNLVDAARRGVRVTMVLEGKPRISGANEDVIALLSGMRGLGSGLRTIALPGVPSPPGIGWKPQVHEKIYCFSHPEPVAYVGSFNPSGDFPEKDPSILRKIGDHNIAHNALVAIRDPAMVAFLTEHIRSLHRDGSSLMYRFFSHMPRSLDFDHTVLHFWPRIGPHPVERFLAGFGQGARVRIAASHIRNPAAAKCLDKLFKRGAQVEILSEFTSRRVTPKIEKRLLAAGISFERLGRAQNVPMHLKLVLVENGGDRWTVFGSFNWTRPSYWLNHEICAISSNPLIYEAFDQRWNELRPA